MFPSQRGCAKRELSFERDRLLSSVFFQCVFSQGGKQFFPSYTELARASLPAGIACVAGAINKRLSCNKVIWTREKPRHTRVSLARPFFFAPVLSFSLRCVLSSLRPQTSGGRRTVLSQLVPANEMGWPNLHVYFPVPPFLFTTGNPCWIPVVDWHSAIKRVTSLNSSEIKGMSLVRSSH